VYKWSYNRCVKYWLKILNRWEKNSENRRGDFFLLTLYVNVDFSLVYWPTEQFTTNLACQYYVTEHFHVVAQFSSFQTLTDVIWYLCDFSLVLVPLDNNRYVLLHGISIFQYWWVVIESEDHRMLCRWLTLLYGFCRASEGGSSNLVCKMKLLITFVHYLCSLWFDPSSSGVATTLLFIVHLTSLLLMVFLLLLLLLLSLYECAGVAPPPGHLSFILAFSQELVKRQQQQKWHDAALINVSFLVV